MVCDHCVEPNLETLQRVAGICVLHSFEPALETLQRMSGICCLHPLRRAKPRNIATRGRHLWFALRKLETLHGRDLRFALVA